MQAGGIMMAFQLSLVFFFFFFFSGFLFFFFGARGGFQATIGPHLDNGIV